MNTANADALDRQLALERVGAGAAPLFAALHGEAFARGWSLESFATLLKTPGAFGLVARIGNAPVGLALARVAGDEAELMTIGVSPGLRGRGVGRRLLEAVESGAREAGAERVFLEVAATNVAARALYVAAGYGQAGVRARYYANGEDALVLAKPLI